GLARFDGQDFRTLTARDGLASDTVYSLAQDRDGSLWVGQQNGLNQLRDGRVVGTYTVRRGLPSNIIRSLQQDRSGALWVGTPSGLALLRDGRFELPVGDTRDAFVVTADELCARLCIDYVHH